MTAEIAVMNKQGVALAADSAVTISGGEGPKILTSANKIFMLSKYKPVGIMIYGNASLLGVPWETIIKTYRKQLGVRSFDDLTGFAGDFLEYLGGNGHLFPDAAQTAYVTQAVGQIFGAIANEAREQIRERLRAGKGPVTATDVEEEVTATTRRVIAAWREENEMPFHSGDRAEALRRTYRSTLTTLRRRVFERIPLRAETVDGLFEVAGLLLTRRPPIELPGVTGVVIAGYGDRDIFPSYLEVMVDGVAGDELVAWIEDTRSIGDKHHAVLKGFAQREMVHRFMQGVDPEYLTTMRKSLDLILRGYTTALVRKLGSRPSKATRDAIEVARRALLEDYSVELANHRRSAYSDQVLAS